MEIQLGNKKLNIRGWKGKDKKAFLSSIKAEALDEKRVMESIVYECIEEKNVVLSIEEFKYVLVKIRAISLGEEIKINFYCRKCSELFEKTFLLKDIIKYSYKDLKEIKAPGVVIKLDEIKNKEIYIQKLKEDDLYDLLLRVKSFNGDDTFTLDELMDKFDDLDLSVLSNIIEQYEAAKFKVLDVNAVTCPSCQDVINYEFDELPEFFPSSWFNG